MLRGIFFTSQFKVARTQKQIVTDMTNRKGAGEGGGVDKTEQKIIVTERGAGGVDKTKKGGKRHKGRDGNII